MPSFKLTVPSSLDEALSLLNPDDDVLLWGGGVASTILMKQKLLAPSVVIGLERVQELYGITQEEDGSLRLGAMVRLRDMELSPLLAGLLPSLSETAKVIANVRVRNAATLGGHLIHADPAQDLPPMLLALDAAVKLQSKTGQRIVALNEFFADTMETVIRPDEILVEVAIPAKALARASRYVKFRPRSQDDYCTVGVAASIAYEADGSTVREASVAVGGAGPVACRFPDAERLLVGKSLTKSLLNEVAEVVHEQAEPWDDARGSEIYKRDMAAVWTKRVLASLAGDPTSEETIA
ncbi:xanthine dehydrogenase family protein subunit M [Paenibacillus validus]|uniref:FAD binding domain-containing protein n=1 Tax=Paenibacillus TaxID=44249 RepID=UPI0013DFFF8D|nr:MULTISPECIES: xanthine dehydrogenase family protein subunit M [Paenibacillus]MED4601883.1 xanthine dehydrogenase family protein subunit M [Paenibacillus validus]MED4606435.1 xanthine dehydrogenase family protein subunit M [Paenibacillus validus]